ncbi:MAG TPA: hypothetical protein VJJ21_02285 [Candidatus Nanoarchaeia archaeon]|nr:hypothetical protein [Candidatus Nanoarchaeia archaeon]
MGLPYFSKETKTKSNILEILSQEWPLTAKKIFFNTKKSAKSVSYQAVFKALQELVKEKVITKEGREYYISPIWTQKSNILLKNLQEKYEEKGLITSKKEVEELNFPTMKALWVDVMTKLKKGYFGESKQIYMKLNRLFFLPFPSEDVTFLKKYLKDKEVIIFCKDNSFLSQFVKKYLESFNVKIYLGVIGKPLTEVDIGECVLYMHDEPERRLEKEINDAFKLKETNEKFWQFYGKIFDTQNPCKLIIRRNPEFVRKNRQEMEALSKKVKTKP